MIGPGSGVRVYLACGVTDMRKRIEGLAALAQNVLRQKPTGGAVFAFRDKRVDRLLELPVTKQSEGTSLPSATMTTVEPDGSGMSNIWVRADNITIPGMDRRASGKGPLGKGSNNWNTKTGNLQPAMTG